MTRAFLITMILLLSLLSYSQTSDSIPKSDSISLSIDKEWTKTYYYDKDWKETTEGKHKFYRVFTVSSLNYLEQNLYYYIEYYKNGKKRREGYSKRHDKMSPMALTIMYEKNRDISGYILYDYDYYIKDFPEIKVYTSKINIIDYDKKALIIKLSKNNVTSIGFLTKKKKRIGQWKSYKKNGKYYVADFKEGESSSIVRVYNREGVLIKKQYYLPKT